MKRLAAYILVVVATLLVLVVIWRFRAVVGLFILSLFVAAAVRPVIVQLQTHGISHAVAMILTYLATLAVVGLWLYIVSGSMIDEAQTLMNELAKGYERMHLVWQEGSALQQAIAASLPPPQALYEAIATEEGTVLAQSLFAVVRSVGTILGGVAVVLVFSIYWSLDRAHFERLWLSLVPAGRRARARNVWRAVEEGVGAFVRSEVIQVFMAVLLLGIGYILMGLDYPTLLALMGAIAWWIPIVGFVFAVVPALIVGLTMSTAMGIAAAGYTLAVLLVLEYFVEPRLFNRRQLYSSLFVVLVMIPMANTYGLFGLFAASPLAVAIEILLVQLFNQRRMEVESVYSASRLEELASQLQEVLARTEEREETLTPEAESLLRRLAELVQKADTALKKEATGGRPELSSSEGKAPA